MSPSLIAERPTELPPSRGSPAPPAARAPRYTRAELNVLHAVNPFVAALLRSPLHRLVSGGLMLLTYTGRRPYSPRWSG